MFLTALILLSLIASIKIIDATQQNNDLNSRIQLQLSHVPENIYQPSAYQMNISTYVPWNVQYDNLPPFELKFGWTMESVIWRATNIDNQLLTDPSLHIYVLTKEIETIETLVKNNFTQVVSLVNGKASSQFNKFVQQSNVVMHVLSQSFVLDVDPMYWCQKMMSILIDLSSSQQQIRQLHFAVAAMVDAYIHQWYCLILFKPFTNMMTRLQFITRIDDTVMSNAMQWYYDYIFKKYIVKYNVTDEELLARLYHVFLLPCTSNIKRYGGENQFKQYHAMILIKLQELTQYCLNNGLIIRQQHENVNIKGPVVRNAIEKQMDYLLSEIFSYIRSGSAITRKWIEIGFPALESNHKRFWYSLLL